MKRGLRVALLVGVAALLLLAGVAYHFRYLLASRLHVSLGEDAGALGLVVVEDVPLNGSASRFDYQAIDAQQRMLYVAHLGGDSVVAFDLQKGEVRKDIGGIPSPHGVAIAPDEGLVLVSATGAREVDAIDERTLQVVERIPDAGEFPDGLAYDAATRKAFASDESGGGVIVLDAQSFARVDRIDLGGEVGNTQADPVGHQIVVAAQGRGQLAIVDPTRDVVTTSIDLPGCRGPHGFTIDGPARVAYVSCEQNAKLVVVDLAKRIETGARFDVGDVPDVLALDAGLHRLYVATESGVVSVFQTDGASIRLLGSAYLAPAAHSIAVDPATHRVYVPLESVGGHPVLRILRPIDGGS